MRKYLFVFLLSLVFTACQPVTPFEQGQQEYVSGNYLKAAQIFAQHTAWNSDIKYEAMYYEGMCWLNLKSYVKAKKLFTTVIEHSDNRVIKSKAIAAKADACLATDDCDGAIAMYRMLLLAGYADYYPQDEAYQLLRKAAEQCGNTAVLEEYVQRFGEVSPAQSATALGSSLKRVRLESQFGNKTEAVAIMRLLKDAGVDSSLVKIIAPEGESYVIQVGAFSSAANADSMAQKVFNLGWKTVIIE